MYDETTNLLASLSKGDIAMPNPLLAFMVVIGAYLLGSVPFAYIIAQVAGGVDIRKVGDGNVGAKNTYHTVSPLAGLTAGAADIGKGMLAVSLAQYLTGSREAAMIAGLAAVLGHDFSIFLRFQGGQGMAAMIGIFLVFFTIPTFIALLLFFITYRLTHNWDASWAVGFPSMVLLVALTGQGWIAVAYTILLLPTIALRKLLQQLAARRVRAG